MPKDRNPGRRNPTVTEWCGASQWHPRVHWDWLGHELFFWLFGFKASYKASEVLGLLEEAMLGQGHTAYTCYELIGPYDLIVRVWMRPDDVRQMDKEFDALLRPKGMIESQRFSVQRIVRHWVWASKRNGTGRLRMPRPGVLEEGRPDRERARIDARHTPDGPVDARLLRRYRRDGLIAPAPSSPGIKLVLLIRPVKPVDNDARLLMRTQLADLLDQSGGLLRERSLYYGEHQALMFLIMCRVPFQSFHLIRTRLIAKIAEALGLVDVRITTHAVTSPGALRFRDTLPRRAASQTPAPDIEALLSEGESARAEFKGSAFAPLKDWLNDGKEPREEEGFAVGTVLKAIGSFLNSGGGTLVIGVLEDKHGFGPTAADRLAGYPSVNTFICIGLQDPTFRKRGWDAYATKLEQLIRGRIEPEPGPSVEIRRAEFRGQTLCVITVDDDPFETGAFYVKAKGKSPALFVRRGAITRLLEGPDIERHHQRRRRRQAGARKEAK